MTEGNSGLLGGNQAQSVPLPAQLVQYGVALLSVAAALGINLLFRSYLEPTPTPVFFAAVMISAWYGGLGPGLLATALSTLAINYFYIEPFYSLNIPNVGYLARSSVFVMAATLINSLNQAQRSAKHRAEANLQALRNSEARFSRLAESGIIGTLVADLSGSVIDANDAFLRMVGYSREDLHSGRVRWQEMTPPEYLDVSERSQEELRTHGVCTPFEKEYIRKDGSRVSVLLGSAMLGKSTVIGFVVDITERKQAEEKLQRANQTLQTLLDACPVAIAFFDPQGIVRLWNRAAEQIFGWSAEEAIGQFMPTVPHRPQAFLASIQTVLSGRSLDGLEAQHQRKDGRMVDLEIWANLTHDAEGNPGCLGIAWDITERKQAEAALRQSEERLRVALKNSPITVFNQDQELRYTWIYNPTIDFDATEVIGRQEVDLFSSNDAAKLTAIKRRVLETGIAVREEISLTMQGQNFYYDMTAEPLLSSNGEMIGITCACIDITERKQMELALRQSETTLSALIASSPIGIALFDQDLRYVHANEALAEINGIALSEHLGRTLWEVLPEWAPTVAPILQQVMATQAPLLNQEVSGVTHASDQIRYGLVNYFPVCLPDRQVLGTGVTAIDITERRRMEESLQQSEERYRAVYDQVLIGIFQIDLTGKIISANERFCEIVGRSPEELLTLRMQDITYADDLPPSLMLFQQMLEDGTSFEIEKRYVRPDDSLVWVRNYVSLIRDTDRQPQRGVTVTEDITDRKQAETEREQLLAREKAAREEAETANRIKDEFLAVLSHELRSPLNPILGWSKLLQTQKLDQQKTQQALASIERNAKLQTQLIEDLLDVSRILRGKLTLNVAPISLINTIEAALETVRLAVEAKSIEMRFEIAGRGAEHSFTHPPIQVMGDAARLQQVIWNLLTNAVKFTPPRGTVEIRLEHVERESMDTTHPSPYSLNSYAQITVTDTGKGIAPEFLPYVFDYFRQEDGSTTRKFGGLGLGLAIVRHITELHGGTVRAESPGEGMGATFIVRLPLPGCRESGVDSEGNSADSQLSASHSPLTGVRVLAVDDDADIRSLIEFILQQAGANVRVVASATEVLQQLEAFSPDILISDVGMPGVDGYMLMQQVRSLPTKRTIPAIALTAYAGELDQQQAIAAGFQMHLAKPIEPEGLIEAIVALLEQQAEERRQEAES